MEDLPKRKRSRLNGYDYSRNGCYFITVCTKNRDELLGTLSVGRDAHIPPQNGNIAQEDAGRPSSTISITLSDAGKTTEEYILRIGQVYDA